jgi:hypothetical protein
VRIAIRIALSVITVISGAYLLLLCLLGAPSLWFVIAAFLIVIAGIAGMFSLIAIGGTSFPPLLVTTPVILAADIWNKQYIGLLSALAVAWATAITSVVMSRRALRPLTKYLAASCTLLAVCFGIDRTFTNKIQLHDYEMEWASGSNDPLNIGPEKIGDQTKVVVYRIDHGSTCYDSIYSNELADYLGNLKKPKVHVQYEVFYDFGKSRGYNVRSIEAMLITKNAHPVLRVVRSEGGTIGNGTSVGECHR